MPTSDFEPFFDLSSDLLCVLDEEGRFLRANASFRRVLGWETTALQGRDFLSLVHDGDVTTSATHLKQLAAGGSATTVTNRVRHADGGYRHVQWLTNGPPAGGRLFVAGRLSQDERAATAADPERLAGDVLTQLADHISDFLWVRDADSGAILYLNDVWERITGHKVPVGSHIREFFKSTHPDDVARATQATNHTTQGGYDQLVRAIDSNGSTRWMRVRTFPVRNADGRVYRVVGIAEDVTELQMAEEALRNSEERFRSLLEYSSDLIILLDAEGRFAYLNPSFETTLGFAIGDWLGRSGFDLVWPEDMHKARVTMARARQTPGARFTWRLRVKHADGSWRWLEGTTTNHLLNRAIAGFVVNCRDVTDRTRMEMQFVQAQKMESIGRLAGGIAHDFNNLLTAIKGNLELALTDVRPDDPLFEFLTGADKGADSATSLTRQLLAFSRKQVIAPRVINLNDVVARVRTLLARLIGEDIRLEEFTARDLAAVRLDPSQAEQILINMAVNARDAMPRGGRLTIETSNVDLDEEYFRSHPYVTPGRYVMLAVSDTGSGMSAEVQANLFEPFFTTKEAGRGTGLGLAMVYGAVKQNGGYIEVYSEPEHGATFKIYLPVVNELAEPAPEPRDDLRPRGKETILLVEDDERVRVVASRMLERLGYTVHAFADGPSAISAVERMPEVPPLLITDVVMPAMNGQILTQQLIALRPSLKVLFTSGYTANVIVHHGVLEEGIEFLAKPYSLDQLARRVRDVLDARGA
jgi:two-component system cell cycle sensor histidine kinase/response regulator CckA